MYLNRKNSFFIFYHLAIHELFFTKMFLKLQVNVSKTSHWKYSWDGHKLLTILRMYMEWIKFESSLQSKSKPPAAVFDEVIPFFCWRVLQWFAEIEDIKSFQR